MSDFALDKFVATKAGEPYRWLPFGSITKGGRKLEITHEWASRLKLPPFKPPIKLGSHDDPTPAGGHIVGFEVRADGVYVIPEYVPAGERALNEGAYRYHSPEFLYGGSMELPDGSRLEAPLILGDALLHMPHLGERASLYTQEMRMEINMTEQHTVPTPLWDKFMAWFDRNAGPPEPAPPSPPPAVPEEFTAKLTAAQAKSEQLEAEITRRDSEAAQAARVATFSAELAETKADPTLATTLAALPEEAARAIVTQLKALSAQIDEHITDPLGKPGSGSDDPVTTFDAAIRAEMEASKTDYGAAAVAVATRKPELYAAYRSAAPSKE